MLHIQKVLWKKCLHHAPHTKVPQKSAFTMPRIEKVLWKKCLHHAPHTKVLWKKRLRHAPQTKVPQKKCLRHVPHRKSAVKKVLWKKCHKKGLHHAPHRKSAVKKVPAPCSTHKSAVKKKCHKKVPSPCPTHESAMEKCLFAVLLPLRRPRTRARLSRREALAKVVGKIGYPKFKVKVKYHHTITQNGKVSLEKVPSSCSKKCLCHGLALNHLQTCERP